MNVLIYLIPIALFMGGVGLAAFIWSLKSGQYDDLEGAAWIAVMMEDVVVHVAGVGCRDLLWGRPARCIDGVDSRVVEIDRHHGVFAGEIHRVCDVVRGFVVMGRHGRPWKGMGSLAEGSHRIRVWVRWQRV